MVDFTWNSNFKPHLSTAFPILSYPVLSNKTDNLINEKYIIDKIYANKKRNAKFPKQNFIKKNSSTIGFFFCSKRFSKIYKNIKDTEWIQNEFISNINFEIYEGIKKEQTLKPSRLSDWLMILTVVLPPEAWNVTSGGSTFIAIPNYNTCKYTVAMKEYTEKCKPYGTLWKLKLKWNISSEIF